MFPVLTNKAMKLRIEEAVAVLKEPWSPVEIGWFNDQVIRLGLFRGEDHWHIHEREDEAFLVHNGKLTIQLRDRENIVLHAGEMGVVPKGTEHCPKCEKDTYVLMIEPATLQSEGDR